MYIAMIINDAVDMQLVYLSILDMTHTLCVGIEIPVPVRVSSTSLNSLLSKAMVTAA